MNKKIGELFFTTSGQLKIVEKIKFEIAFWLDRKHHDWCWASLATWAMGYDSF